MKAEDLNSSIENIFNRGIQTVDKSDSYETTMKPPGNEISSGRNKSVKLKTIQEMKSAKLMKDQDQPPGTIFE